MSNLTSRESGRSGGVRTQRSWQRFFLERLERMVLARRERDPLFEAGDVDLRLLHKAVYSTFCDCLDLGAGEQARTILRREGFGNPSGEASESGNN